MSREWKPGDVAMAEKGGLSFMVTRHAGEPDYWSALNGVWPAPATGSVAEFSFRPLVVLDPESDEDAKRLAEELYLAGMFGMDNTDGAYRVGTADRVQAALRELANPTPPKPDEPTGIGAVVVDHEGEMYVRARPDGGPAKWEHVTNQVDVDRSRTWSEIPAVQVLSEGVDPEAVKA